MIQALVVVDGLCHDHVFVHEDDGEHLSRRICTVSCSFVEGPARMEANFTCTKQDCMVMLSVTWGLWREASGIEA